jgi:6-phosphogluconolactonase
MAVEILSYANDVALAQAAAGDWLKQLSAAITKPGRSLVYTAALSGGRIAKLFCAEIAKQAQTIPGLQQTAFTKIVHFYWADERCVPPTDPESNYAIARQLLFQPLGVPESQIHRLRGEEQEPVALRDAMENIYNRATIVNGLPVFDIIFLGMGEDGHVASLFPGESETAMSDPSVYRAVTAIKPPPRRITLGYSTIAAAREVWVIASGAGKEGALKASLSPDEKTPLARVLKSRVNTRILTDILLK